SVDTNDTISGLPCTRIGTTTLPLGCTTGWPPMTAVDGAVEAFQVCPPSLEYASRRVPPVAASSHWTEQFPKNGLEAVSSQAIQSLSRFPTAVVATAIGAPQWRPSVDRFTSTAGACSGASSARVAMSHVWCFAS